MAKEIKMVVVQLPSKVRIFLDINPEIFSFYCDLFRNGILTQSELNLLLKNFETLHPLFFNGDEYERVPPELFKAVVAEAEQDPDFARHTFVRYCKERKLPYNFWARQTVRGLHDLVSDCVHSRCNALETCKSLTRYWLILAETLVRLSADLQELLAALAQVK